MENQGFPPTSYPNGHSPNFPANSSVKHHDPFASGTQFFNTEFVPISPSETQEPDSAIAAHLLAVEEEKRRRNTAASARFRQKKKEREQALEKTAMEMTEKVRGLEQKVGQLELENKWLRGLIVERRRKMSSMMEDDAGEGSGSSRKSGDGKKSRKKGSTDVETEKSLHKGNDGVEDE
ncbi:uncharacterized protein PV09_07715 [Verruconis gallopava]|uniref:BZIP domain-containing protein n=1 Tax=Verruconis gallopava TaxID=253628 RepID=A0A0D2A2X0_9PEZI|nr:uncharacterized protein PV09_07715 [Verruconis gallopava]KIW00730.1 hypothetical protein PV09_07715 [Verruconis gallopava]